MSLAQSEKVFILEGINQGIRNDGRGNQDCRSFTIHPGTVPEAFGSCTLQFGEDDTQIVCAIKAEIMKPLKSEPENGQIDLYLETCQTGRSLFVREDQADIQKKRMQALLQKLLCNIVDRSELQIFKDEFCWFLHVDLLVFSELNLEQIDYIGICMRSALGNLQLPQTIATLNNNTQKIEIGLVEEVYTDRENTDECIKLKSQEHAPYIISVGVIRSDSNGSQEVSSVVILDADQTELLCVDQILHIAVDSNLRIHAVEQSKADGGSNFAEGDAGVTSGIPANLFLKGNLRNLLKNRLAELEQITKN